jgi:D-serine deaminase-like pyridoxal phosphate-dependent protein
MNMEELDTPSLVVDLDKLEKNIVDMSERAKKWGIRLRPHIKTHKIPEIAQMQVKHGASGITAAKLGEAEVMLAHGIRDILIAYPVIGSKKLERLKNLILSADQIVVSLDSFEAAEGLSELGQNIGQPIKVYVEVDTGLHRLGRPSGRETVDFLKELKRYPYLEIFGLMTHAGHAYKAKTREEVREVSHSEARQLVETKKMAKEMLGLDISHVSVGSTPTSYFSGEVEGVTEMRPGTYVFNDDNLRVLGMVSEEELALKILATVISKPNGRRLTLDAGSKTLTSDTSLIRGHGVIEGYPELRISRLSEEHGVVEIEEEDFHLNVGDRVWIVPNHVCPTVNLADSLYGVRNGKVEKVFHVAARGKNQ